VWSVANGCLVWRSRGGRDFYSLESERDGELGLDGQGRGAAGPAALGRRAPLSSRLYMEVDGVSRQVPEDEERDAVRAGHREGGYPYLGSQRCILEGDVDAEVSYRCHIMVTIFQNPPLSLVSFIDSKREGLAEGDDTRDTPRHKWRHVRTWEVGETQLPVVNESSRNPQLRN